LTIAVSTISGVTGFIGVLIILKIDSPWARSHIEIRYGMNLKIIIDIKFFVFTMKDSISIYAAKMKEMIAIVVIVFPFYF